MSVGYYFKGKDQVYRKQAQTSRSPGMMVRPALKITGISCILELQTTGGE